MLGFARESECADPYQDANLLQAQGDSAQKIIQAFVFPILVPLECYLLGYLGFQTFQVNEPNINLTIIDSCKVFAEVNARCLNLCAVHPRFVKIKFGPVESSEVVDDAHHEFKGKMSFEIQALIAFNRIAGRMAFCKRVAGEAFDFIPNPVDYFLVISFLHDNCERTGHAHFEILRGNDIFQTYRGVIRRLA